MVKSTTWLTQCPECETRFWIKDEQLQAARGAVRCGSCKGVFKATEHLISTEDQKGAREKQKLNLAKTPKQAKKKKAEVKSDRRKVSDLNSQLKKLGKKHHLPEKNRKRHWLLWGLFDLMAVSVLIGQYIFFNFDDLSQQEEWFPILNAICAPIGCTPVPPPLSLSIVTDQLVVRSAPAHKNVLVVDAVIRNEAETPVSYPLVELRFMDKSDRTVANRVFKPEEYLSGEMKKVKLMQAEQPTHFSLHVVDPGEHAVSYSLQFHPNDYQ